MYRFNRTQSTQALSTTTLKPQSLTSRSRSGQSDPVTPVNSRDTDLLADGERGQHEKNVDNIRTEIKMASTGVR